MLTHLLSIPRSATLYDEAQALAIVESDRVVYDEVHALAVEMESRVGIMMPVTFTTAIPYLRHPGLPRGTVAKGLPIFLKKRLANPIPLKMPMTPRAEANAPKMSDPLAASAKETPPLGTP